ncbi:GlxA family transcriptional regulator [Luteimicrobium sp. NPDC057192]|uniref:GlxA family transcriptional regulator n=1 Tax=Luteimicrobium sp. NPDC057192 TaxID=3346042 RepID=UPI00363146C0
MVHRVAVLALESVVAFDLGIAARVLNEARGPDGEPLYDVVTCTIGGRPVRTDGDLLLAAAHDESALASAQTVVVATQEPTGRLLAEGALEPEVARALALIRPEARVVSLCTSAFVLAAAGLLDGLKATTHWALALRFRELFPAVRLDPDVLFVDNGRVLTGAGAAAGIDLFLHLVRRDHGSAVANVAARHCVAAPWRDGGQAQFLELPTPSATASTTGPTRAWALEHLADPLSLERLAAHAHLSVRTFTRRFRAEVGVSPAQWLTRQRLERARWLLESSGLPVEQVASAVGLGSPMALRRHFAATFGVSPSTYRRTFRGVEVAA